MKVKSQLRGEVLSLVRDIETQELECWQRLGRLKVLKDRAFDMAERLGAGAASRDELESYGALHDEVRRDS